MSIGEFGTLLLVVLGLGSLLFVIGSMFRSMRNERRSGQSLWRQFGLGIALMVLFFATWAGQAIAEWQVFTDEQHELGRSAGVADFVSVFAQSTLENWQSEFLQLFAFVSLAALYVYRGSAESKDSDEKMAAALRRIEERLGTLPDEAPDEHGAQHKLPDVEDVYGE